MLGCYKDIFHGRSCRSLASRSVYSPPPANPLNPSYEITINEYYREKQKSSKLVFPERNSHTLLHFFYHLRTHNYKKKTFKISTRSVKVFISDSKNKNDVTHKNSKNMNKTICSNTKDSVNGGEEIMLVHIVKGHSR